MAKSSDTTDDRVPFYNPRHALIAEVVGALFLVIAVFVSHAWRRHVWEERRSQIPKATVQDMLCWLDTKPNPVFKKKAWRTSHQGHSSGARHAVLDRGRQEATAEETLPVLDINHATATEWKRLPGWGEVLSKRTVKFREALGGFVSIEQLKLVYGIGIPMSWKEIGFLLKVQEGAQTRMCLDTLSFSHPCGTPTVRCGSNQAGASCSRSSVVKHGCVLGAGFPPIQRNVRSGSRIWTLVMGIKGWRAKQGFSGLCRPLWSSTTGIHATDFDL